MAKKNECMIEIDAQTFKDMIYIFRDQQVMLDSDLAAIYGYSTKAFNQQVKNNAEKFEEDFMFRLNSDEVQQLSRCKNSTSNDNETSRSKNLTMKTDRGHNIKYAPYVFTEQGIYTKPATCPALNRISISIKRKQKIVVGSLGMGLPTTGSGCLSKCQTIRS